MRKPFTLALMAGCCLVVLIEARPALAQSARPAKLTPQALDQSIELSRRFLLNCQREDGSFIYELDAAKGVDLGTRNAVREIGALWALSFIQRQNPTPQTAAAIVRSLKYQDLYARRTAAGGKYLTEPGAKEWTTNAVAIYALALLDFLASDEGSMDAAVRKKCQADLAATMKFLMSLRLSGGRFSSTYRVADGLGVEAPTPHSDGEVLLALVRYAKEQSTDDAALRDAVIESAAIMYSTYVRSALRADPQSEDAQGFYQWGSMAFYELYTSGWPGTESYAARTIAMAQWTIDVRGILKLPGNSCHSYEGLAVAWELARLTKDTKGQRHIGDTIERGLGKLITWQVGSPLAGDAVPKTFNRSPKSQGGVLSAPADPRIRIDTVQHQTHATQLTRWLMFRPEEADAGGR